MHFKEMPDIIILCLKCTRIDYSKINMIELKIDAFCQTEIFRSRITSKIYLTSRKFMCKQKVFGYNHVKRIRVGECYCLTLYINILLKRDILCSLQL